MQKIKWGLIGCGDIARKRIIPALLDLENCELVSICRENYLLTESCAREYGIKKWFRYWQELIKDNEIDAVYIATPVYLHAKQAIAAAQSGKHVLCEKPMALNTLECDQMIEACERNNVKLGISYYRHFYPAINRIKELLASDEIGKPVMAEINAFEWFDRKPGEPRYWFLEKNKSGGGPMMDFGCHRIEVLQNIFGKIKNIQSQLFNLHFEREVEDTGYLSLLFENNVIATLKVSHAVFEPKDTLDIYGTKGTIRIPVLNKGEIQITTKEGTRIENHPPHKNIHQPLIEDFAQSILCEREPVVTGKIGREVNIVLEEIYDQAAISKLFNKHSSY